jgi:hypothetical protein
MVTYALIAAICVSLASHFTTTLGQTIFVRVARHPGPRCNTFVLPAVDLHAAPERHRSTSSVRRISKPIEAHQTGCFPLHSEPAPLMRRINNGSNSSSGSRRTSLMTTVGAKDQ